MSGGHSLVRLSQQNYLFRFRLQNEFVRLKHENCLEGCGKLQAQKLPSTFQTSELHGKVQLVMVSDGNQFARSSQQNYLIRLRHQNYLVSLSASKLHCTIYLVMLSVCQGSVWSIQQDNKVQAPKLLGQVQAPKPLGQVQASKLLHLGFKITL